MAVSFNTPLEMRSQACLHMRLSLNSIYFQYSIGDAITYSTLAVNLTDVGFQYSIGDALLMTARAHLTYRSFFQYSIGDAPRARHHEHVALGPVLSILHWRCECWRSTASSTSNMLSILHWRCRRCGSWRGAGACGRPFNTPLEMQDNEVVHEQAIARASFNTPLEMRSLTVLRSVEPPCPNPFQYSIGDA